MNNAEQSSETSERFSSMNVSWIPNLQITEHICFNAWSLITPLFLGIERKKRISHQLPRLIRNGIDLIYVWIYLVCLYGCLFVSCVSFQKYLNCPSEPKINKWMSIIYCSMLSANQQYCSSKNKINQNVVFLHSFLFVFYFAYTHSM